MATLHEFTLPGHSRVWIYQSSRFFTPEETGLIQHKIDDFVASWHAHNVPLSAQIMIKHGLFIVIAVDEMVAKASGCSIDKSVRLIKDLENELNLALTGRTSVAYFDAENKIQLVHFHELKEKLQNRTIDENLNMFNNLVSTLDDMKARWVIPIKDSWLNQIPA
jgi:hypothetical protein